MQSSDLITILHDGQAPALHALERQLMGWPEPLQPPLLEALFSDAVQVRRNAAWLLRKIGDKGAVEWLLDSLQDTDPQVRQFAALALGNIGDQRAVEPLSFMLDDPDVSVRLNSVRALGKLKAYTAVSLLIIILKNNREDSEVQAAAARELGKLRAREAINALYNSLNHKEPSVQHESAMALARIGPEALPRLLDGLHNDKKNYRRRQQAAAMALGWMIGSGRLADHYEAQTAAMEALIAEAGSTERGVRVEIAQALGCTNDIRAVEPLTVGLLYDVPAVRRSAAKALKELAQNSNIKLSGVVEVLHEALRDQDIDVRYNAIEALGFVRDQAAIPILLALITHPDSEIRERAIIALGDTHREEVVKPVSRLLRERDPWVRRCAALALGKLEHTRAVKPLLIALSDPEPIVRQWAALSLARIGDPSVIPNLRDHHDDDRRVRHAIQSAIVQLGG